jgi:hypothetical protein
MHPSQYPEKLAGTASNQISRGTLSGEVREIPMAAALGTLDHEIGELGTSLEILMQRLGCVMEPTGPAPVDNSKVPGSFSEAQMVQTVSSSAHRVRMHRELVTDMLRRLAI